VGSEKKKSKVGSDVKFQPQTANELFGVY